MKVVASIQKFYLPLFLPLLLVSCSSSTPENTDVFPQKIDITPQSTTDFIANLEHALPEGKNVIYTPSFLFAWDNLRNQLPEIQLTSATTNDDISQVQSTTTFKNAMSKKDYEKDVQIQDDTISISSKQRIELTFVSDLQGTSGISFKGTLVDAFGMEKFDQKIVDNSELSYYKDDNNFILKLKTKDANSEVSFLKGLSNSSTFTDVMSQLKTLSVQGKSQLIDGDTFSIPKMFFNLSKEYITLDGQKISNQDTPYIMKKAYQETGLKLDGTGVVIASENKTGAKHLQLNDTFYMIVRHTGQENPYFMMKVESGDLMKKVK